MPDYILFVGRNTKHKKHKQELKERQFEKKVRETGWGVLIFISSIFPSPFLQSVNDSKN